MKIAARDALRACVKPSSDWVGAFLYGPDQGLVAEQRKVLVEALSTTGNQDLQVTRISGADARKDPAEIAAVLTTRGFFSGRPIVVVDDGTDGLAAALGPVLKHMEQGEGFLIVTAGQTPPKSRLRKLFESEAHLASIALFPRPMNAGEIDDALRSRGVSAIASDAVGFLAELADRMDHGAFLQLIDLIALFALDRPEPLNIGDVEALAPSGLEGQVSEFVQCVADGQVTSIGPTLRRLQASGIAPVAILIMLQQHFRALFLAETSGQGIAALRPQPQGPRRDSFLRQMRAWTGNRLEQANRLLFEVDGQVRSSAPVPDFALLERASLRLAMMAAR